MTQLERKIRGLILSLPNSRNRTIVRLRFGLGRKQGQTLEQVGQNYGLTRERVRQIERDSLIFMRQISDFKELTPVFDRLNQFFSQYGQVAEEETVFKFLTPRGEGSTAPARFLLAVGEPYLSRPANILYNQHWGCGQPALRKADGVINHFVKLFLQTEKPLARMELLQKSPNGVSEQALLSYLSITKLISRNQFDEFGLSSWGDICPKGVRDKAYLILKREGKPLHFNQITAKINRVDFGDGKEAQVQTVHNELIKDSRFYWIKRGTYAISDNERLA